MKKVFPNSLQCIHVWAQQTQSEGRSSNVFFECGTLYSYGYHFPLASFLTNKKKEVTLFINIDRYSSTTTGHQADVRNATNHIVNVIRVNNNDVMKRLVNFDPSTGGYHSKTLKELCTSALECTIQRQTSAAAKRKKAHLIEEEIHVAIREYENYQKIFNFFALGKMPAKLTRALDLLKSDHKALLTAQKLEIEKAQKKKNKEIKAKQDKANLLAKKAFSTFIAGEHLDYEETQALKSATQIYMRIDNDKIRTSHGAIFPVVDATLVFPFIKRCKESAKPWKRSGVKNLPSLGNFNIDTIDKDGNVKAGCHFVEWSEIERNARILGLYP